MAKLERAGGSPPQCGTSYPKAPPAPHKQGGNASHLPIGNLPMGLGTLAPSYRLYKCSVLSNFILAVLRTAGHPLPPKSSVYIDFIKEVKIHGKEEKWTVTYLSKG